MFQYIKLIALLTLLICLSPSKVRSITLAAVHVNDPGSGQTVQNVADLVPFYVGESLDESQIEPRLNQLKKLGLVQDAQYKLSRTTKNQYTLEVILTPAKKIRDIKISGNYPILGKDIKKLVPLQPGNMLDTSLFDETTTIIKQYLAKQGYFDSVVGITAKDIAGQNITDLHIQIKKGKTYRIGAVITNGNQLFSNNRMSNRLRHFSHFRPARLKLDIKRIKKSYARKGYIKARIKQEDLIYHDDTKKVDVHLSVRENKKLKLEFNGKSLMNKGHLKEIVGLAQRRSYDRFAIQNGAERLERFYRKSGYPDVWVDSKIIKQNPKEITAVYTINAGRRVELKDINFDGNHKMGSKKLKKVIQSKESGLFSRVYFNHKQLLLDRTKLLETYKENGFFDIVLADTIINTNSIGDHKKVIFPINEGEEYSITKIAITSDKDVDKNALLKKSDLKPNKPYDKNKIERAKTNILDLLQELGFAYSTVTAITTVDHDNHSVDIDFDITRGDKVSIRSIIIDGNLQTHPSTIKKNLKLKIDEPFNYQKMLDGQLKLRKLGIFSSVRLFPMGFDEKQTNIDLVVSVIERKSVVVNLQGGFDSRHLVSGEFNFTKYNLFGQARQFNTRVIGGPKFDRAEVTFFSPRVFGASWNLSNQYFVQYEDEPNFADLSYGGFINTLKNFGSRWTFGFKEQITHTSVFESRSNVAALGNSLFDSTFNEFQLTGILDLRDNFSDPQKGIYVLAKNEISTDYSNIDNNFNTLEFNINNYQGFFNRFTLVNTLRYGHIFKLSGTPRVPANKLFFLGGADTLRGFAEDAVNASGGTVMMIYNSELQVRLTDHLKIAGFFDAGILDTNLNHMDLSNIRESAGTGLRYFTPIGPLRLDWGFILDRQAGEPKSRLHFSFGYFF